MSESCKKESCKKLLAGDIGGTKSNLGLYLRKGGSGAGAVELLAEARYVNSRYASFDDILAEFLQTHLKGESSEVCCTTFGVAATVIDNNCTMTNLSWKIDASKLSAKFGFRRCSLINDLVATAWGLSGLAKEDLYTLQAPPEGTVSNGICALVAAGTGLGEALIVGSEATSGITAIATEGGHTDFGPTDEIQVELLGFLLEKYGHVSYERVVSGTALKDIYSFFLNRRGGEIPPELAARFATEDTGAVITELGLMGAKDGDRDCFDTLNLFVSAYGAEAGNLALKSLPLAGLYIGGGIAPKIVSAMERGFMDSFSAKGRFEPFMRTLPVFIILNESAALLGAAIHASFGGGIKE